MDSFEVDQTYKNIYNITSEDTIIFKITDCFGSCAVRVINKNSQTIITGSYCGDGSIIKTDVNIFNNDGEIIGKRDLYWYEPKKCGVWTFFDCNGKKEKEEKY